MIDLGRFRSGDHRYFESLVRTHAPMVLRICMTYSDSTDHAEDLFQRTWIQAFEKRGSYRGDGSFEAWLRRLANNLCISDFRASRVRQEVLDRMERDPGGENLNWRPPDPQKEVEGREIRGVLVRALGRLPQREREAIHLRILDGRTPQEVADIMKTKKATVRSNIRHGIKRLREILEGFDT